MEAQSVSEKEIHVKERVANAYGTFDTVYRQTLASLVVNKDGTTTQEALDEIHNTLQWHKYRGEYPHELSILSLGESLPLQRCIQNDDGTWSPIDGAFGFEPSSLYYQISIPSVHEALTIQMLSDAYHATRIVLVCGENTAVSSFEGGSADISFALPSGENQASFTVRVCEEAVSLADAEASAWDRTYHFKVSRQNNIAFHTLTVDAETDAPETMFKLWPGNTLPNDFSSMSPGYLPENLDAAEYSVLVNTLTTNLTINAKAPAGSSIRIADADGSQYVASSGAEIIQQYRTPAPTLTSSNEDGEDYIALSATLFLPPCYNGEQSLLCTVETPSGGIGGCKIKVFRDTQGGTASLQTRILGTTSAAIRADRGGYVTLYKKSDALGQMSLKEATSGERPLVPVPVGATYRDMFNAVEAAGHLTKVKQVISDKTSGAYEFLDTDINAVGIYMVVASRPGFLDNVMDNIRIFETYAPAQFSMRNMSLRAGDVNNDGVVGDADKALYMLYRDSFDSATKKEEQAPFLSALPAVLDYDQDNKLTVVDFDYIMGYTMLSTLVQCWMDNISNSRRVLLTAWDKQS